MSLTYSACILTGATVFTQGIKDLAKIPVNEHPALNVWFVVVDNHNVPWANVSM